FCRAARSRLRRCDSQTPSRVYSTRPAALAFATNTWSDETVGEAVSFHLMKLRGIHHITAIAGDPQRNLDFYTECLGLRFVKRTVNFDDPSSYHFYFGDRIGTPGTILTFFPWPGARRGSRGTGQVTTTSFAVPRIATNYWRERAQGWHVTLEQTADRFGDQVLRFTDPDGLLIELITSEHMNQ